MRDIEYSSRCEAEELGRRESLSKPRGREGWSEKRAGARRAGEGRGIIGTLRTDRR